MLSGPVALSTQEQADIIGKTLDRAIKHVDVPPAAAKDGMLKSGMPAGYVEAVLELYAVMKAGQTATVTNTVEEVLGRKPTTFAQFLEKHRGALS